MRARGIILWIPFLLGVAAYGAESTESRLLAARGFMADELYELATRELELLQLNDAGSEEAIEAAFLLAECARAQGNDADALYRDYLERAPAGFHADEALFRIGDSARRRGDSAESLRALGRLILGFPASSLLPDALLRRSRAARAMGDAETASADLERTIEEFPDHRATAYARFDLAVLRMEEGRPELAVATLEPLLDRDDIPELEIPVRLESARAHLRAGEGAQALILLSGLDGIEAHGISGEALLSLSRYGEAIEHLELVVESEGAETDLAYSLAWCLASSERLLEAEEAWVAHADAHGTHSIEALLGAGDAAGRLGRLNAADEYFRRAESMAEQDQLARALLGRGLLRPDSLGALQLFREVAGARGAEPATTHTANMAAGRLLLTLDRPAEAVDAYSQAVEAATSGSIDPADAQYGRAVALLRAGDPETAAQVAAMGRRGKRDMILQAEAELAAGAPAAAESLYLAVAESGETTSDDMRIEALFGVGWCRLGLGDPRGALEWFDRLTVEYPSSARGREAVLRMGDAFTAEGDDDAAQSLYGLYLLHEPTGRLAYDALIGRSRALSRLGRLDEAANAARAARRSASGRSDLAALALALEGQVRFDASSYAEAESLFLAAAEGAESATIAEHAVARVGDCRFNSDDPRGAAEAYATVIRTWPDGDRAEQAVQGLYWAEAEANGDIDASAIVREVIDGAGARGAKIALYEALVLKDRGEDEAARDRFGALASRLPGTPQAAEALYALGSMQSDRDNAAWRTLIRDHPTHSRARTARRILAEEALERGEPRRTLEWLAPLGAGKREDLLLAGLAHAAIDDVEQARVHLEPLAGGEDDETRWRAIVALALIDYTEGDTLSAGSALDTAAKDAPARVAAEARYRSAELLYRQGLFEEALRLFLKIRYLNPEMTDWVRQGELAAGQCYEALGEEAEAHDLYDRLVAGGDADPPGREAAARLRELGR